MWGKFTRLWSFIGVLLLVHGGGVCAQEIYVYDKSDLRPIEHVTINNLDHTKSSLTNVFGKAIISEFNSTDTLIFQHTSYSTLILPFSFVEQNDFRVMMSERSVKLTEVVVAANKWEENREEVPNRIVSINSKDIEFNNPQTTADMLGQSNEVFIQKSQQGGGSPMIRGFAANAVLIVVDGVRMNNAIYRGGNLQNVISLSGNMIDRAEVIMGPGSVMYGSDALGGVMDFHTKSPQIAYDGQNFVKGSFMARYASMNNEATGHFDLNFSTKKWGFFTAISASAFDDLRMGNVHHDDYVRKEYVVQVNGIDEMVGNDNVNRQRYSGYDQLNLMQKVRFRPSDKLDFEYGFHYSTSSNIPRYDRLIQYSDDGNLKYAEWYYGPQEWMMNQLSANISAPNAAFTNSRIIAAAQLYKESRHSRKFQDDVLRNQNEKVWVYSLNADFDKQFDERNFLFYGIEGVFNNVTSTANKQDINTGEESPEGTRYPDGKNHYGSVAAYLNYKRNIGQKLTFLGGLRYTFISSHSTITDQSVYQFDFNTIDLTTNAINGSLGLTWRPVKKSQFNISLASGFRAPNLDDLAKVFDSEPGNVVVPNPDLQPEYSYNLDLGYIQKFGEIAELNVSTYGTYLSNAIVRRDFTLNGQDSILYNGEMSKVQSMVNADYAYIFGANLMFKIDLSEMFAFRTFLNVQRGYDSDGFGMRHIAPLFGGSYLTLKVEKFTTELSALYNGEVSYDRLAPSERSKSYMYATDENGNPYSPAWWTLNLRSSYNFNKSFTVDLIFENILNNRYRPYSSGIVAGGRNLVLALRFRF